MIKEEDIKAYMQKFKVNKEIAIAELESLEENYYRHEEEMQRIFEQK